jgi:hypothetical protein
MLEVNFIMLNVKPASLEFHMSKERHYEASSHFRGCHKR